VALACFQLRDEGGLLALLLGGDVLERRPDFLLVHVVAAHALGLHEVGAGLTEGGTGRQAGGHRDCEREGLH